MPTIFKDNMGNIHIWKKKCSNLERGGLHYGLTTCKGKESDAFIQLHSEDWIDRNLTSKNKHDLSYGDYIYKQTLKDMDDRPSGWDEKPKKRGRKRKD